MESRLKNILFIDLGPKINTLGNKVEMAAWGIVLSIVLFSIVYEFFNRFDFAGIIIRVVQAFATIALFMTCLTIATDYGFDFGDNVMSKDNAVIANWLNANQSFIESWKGVELSIDGITGKVIMFLTNQFAELSLFILSLLYTLAFYFTKVSFPIFAVMSITPFLKKMLNTLWEGIAWLATIPIVLSIILEILHLVLSKKNYTNGMSNFTKGMMTIVVAYIILKIFSFTRSIVMGGGIGEGISSIAGGLSTTLTFAVANNAFKAGNYLIRRGGNLYRRGQENSERLIEVVKDANKGEMPENPNFVQRSAKYYHKATHLGDHVRNFGSKATSKGREKFWEKLKEERHNIKPSRKNGDAAKKSESRKEEANSIDKGSDKNYKPGEKFAGSDRKAHYSADSKRENSLSERMRASYSSKYHGSVKRNSTESKSSSQAKQNNSNTNSRNFTNSSRENKRNNLSTTNMNSEKSIKNKNLNQSVSRVSKDKGRNDGTIRRI
jgi:hypothetical protein